MAVGFMTEDDKLITEFKADLQRRQLSAAVIKTYPLYVRAFKDFTGCDLLFVNIKTLVSYLDHLQERNVAKTSVKRYIAGLGAFYNFLVIMEYIMVNPITPAFRKYYLKSYKSHNVSQRRQAISIAQAQKLVTSILDPKDRAVVVLLLKTGLRVGELTKLNISDVDLSTQTIRLHPTEKRSLETAFFDDETSRVLARWLRQRDGGAKTDALFLDRYGNRISTESVGRIVNRYAVANGLHDPSSDRHDLHKRLTPHSCRHAWTTWLRRAGMSREIRQTLRGDAIKEAVDTYDHLEEDELRASYLRCIPQFGL
jgi:integrase/recombinase XerD